MSSDPLPDTGSYNAVHRPSIPVLPAAGSPTAVSLLDLFSAPPETYRALHAPDVITEFALHSTLATLAARALSLHLDGADDAEALREEVDDLPVAEVQGIITDYLRDHAEAFELNPAAAALTGRTAFAQSPIETPVWTEWVKTGYRSDTAGIESIAASEMFGALCTVLLVNTGGIKSRTHAYDEKKYGTASVHFHNDRANFGVLAETLWDTIMLMVTPNMVADPTDAPSWEAPPPVILDEAEFTQAKATATRGTDFLTVTGPLAFQTHLTRAITSRWDGERVTDLMVTYNNPSSPVAVDATKLVAPYLYAEVRTPAKPNDTVKLRSAGDLREAFDPAMADPAALASHGVLLSPASLDRIAATPGARLAVYSASYATQHGAFFGTHRAVMEAPVRYLTDPVSHALFTETLTLCRSLARTCAYASTNLRADHRGAKRPSATAAEPSALRTRYTADLLHLHGTWATDHATITRADVDAFTDLAAARAAELVVDDARRGGLMTAFRDRGTPRSVYDYLAVALPQTLDPAKAAHALLNITAKGDPVTTCDRSAQFSATALANTDADDPDLYRYVVTSTARIIAAAGNDPAVRADLRTFARSDEPSLGLLDLINAEVLAPGRDYALAAVLDTAALWNGLYTTATAPRIGRGTTGDLIRGARNVRSARTGLDRLLTARTRADMVAALRTVLTTSHRDGVWCNYLRLSRDLAAAYHGADGSEIDQRQQVVWITEYGHALAAAKLHAAERATDNDTPETDS